MSLELLILTVLVIVFLLNVLVRVVRRRLEGLRPAESGPNASRIPAPTQTLFSSPSAEGGGIRPSAPQPPLTAVLRPGRRPKVRIGSAREARHAIVLMAVFGPCRGLEPGRLTRPEDRA